MEHILNNKFIKAIEFRYYKNGEHILTQLMEIDENQLKENKNFTYILNIPTLFLHNESNEDRNILGVNQNVEIRFIFNAEYENMLIRKELIDFMNKYNVDDIEKALREMKQEFINKKREMKQEFINKKKGESSNE